MSSEDLRPGDARRERPVVSGPLLQEAIFEYVEETITVVDRQGRIQYFNRAADALSVESQGRHLELGCRLDEFFSEEVRREFEALFPRALAGEEAILEMASPAASSDGAWWEHRLRPLWDADGDVAAVLIMSISRVEQRRAREEIAELEERFWTFFDVAPIGMDILDADGTILRVNPALEAFIGYNADELVGRRFTQFTHEEETEEAHDLVQDLVAGRVGDGASAPVRHRQHFQVDRRYRRKDGQVVWANLMRLVMLNDDGSLRFVVGMLVDITKRKQAENAANVSAERTRAILDTVIDGIVTIDEQGMIETFSRGAERMFGYGAEEVVGRNVKILMPSPYREEHQGYIERYKRTGQARIIGIGRQVEAVRKEGEVFPVELGINEMWIDGERRFVGVLRDISERRQMERRLRHSERMEALGQLAGGIAHDFNNVLTIVTSYAHTLAAEAEEDSDEAFFLSKISDAAQRGARLTRQLLAFSPEQIGAPQPVNLNQTVTEMEKLVRTVLEADIEVEVHLEDKLPLIEADPGQVEQVFMNLVINARDAMPRGGKLTIRTHWAYVDPENAEVAYPAELTGGDYVMLMVQDTGVGIDEAIQPRIFDPFFTTKERGKGTGLGLATVYGIAQRHGGTITVDSAPGEGATFQVYFPALGDEDVERPETEAFATPEPLLERRHETILLVEDEEDIRLPLKRALEREGYTVLEAGSGEEAIEVARQHPGKIDLLLTDVVMPGFSGVEVSDFLSKQYPGIQAIFVSGYSGDVLARKELAPQQVRVAKPYDIDELKELVRQMLKK